RGAGRRPKDGQEGARGGAPRQLRPDPRLGDRPDDRGRAQRGGGRIGRPPRPARPPSRRPGVPPPGSPVVSSPPPSLDEVRARLRSQGYLDAGIERAIFTAPRASGAILPSAVTGAVACAAAS